MVKVPKKDKPNKYCKFDLFTDNLIGLSSINKIAENEGLIEAQQDEDYKTDHTVLRNTTRLCKKDLLETWKLIVDNQ